MTIKDNVKKGFQPALNRSLYGGFVLLALYYTLIAKDFSMAFSSLGISLAFDPFDTSQPWKERPLYQKICLIIHLFVLTIVAVYALR